MNVKKESEKKKNRAKYSRQIQLEKKKKMDDEIKLQVSMMTRKMRGELSRVIRELSLPPPPKRILYPFIPSISRAFLGAQSRAFWEDLRISRLVVVIYGETEHRTVYSTSDTISGLAVDPLRVHAAIHCERFPVS